MRVRSWFLLFIAGYGLVFGGAELWWELRKAIDFHSPWTTPNWAFCYPLFARCVTSQNWSEPYDVGLTLIVIGAIMIGICGITLGRYTKAPKSIF